jgi:hypothetical protein
MPAIHKPGAPAPQAETCDGTCHQPGIEPAIAKMCQGCKTGTALCCHAKFCKDCAEKKEVCGYCGKPLPSAKKPVMAKLQAELDKALPEHKVGRQLPGERSWLPNVQFFMVVHAGSPCKTCAANAEPLIAIERKDDKEEIHVLTSEKDMSELLKLQKVSGKEEAALAVAELVQALFEPIHGGLEPSNLGKVKLDNGKARFEYKKGHAYWELVVSFDKDGAFTGLEVKDTGRMCK